MFLQPSVHRSIASPSIGCFCRSFSTDNRCSVRSTHLLKEGPFFDFFPSLLKSCREQIASTIKTYLHWIIFVRIIFSLRTDLFSSMEIQTKPIDCQGWMDPWNFEYCKSGVFHRDSWTLLSLFSLSTHVIKGVSSTSKRWSLSNGFCENVTKENLCWLTKSTWLFSQRRRFKCCFITRSKRREVIKTCFPKVGQLWIAVKHTTFEHKIWNWFLAAFLNQLRW